MNKKVKPCPFCGKGDNLMIITAHAKDKYTLTYTGAPVCYINCGNCGAEGPRGLMNHLEQRTPAQEAIYKWNERKSDKELQDLKQHLGMVRDLNAPGTYLTQCGRLLPESVSCHCELCSPNPPANCNWFCRKCRKFWAVAGIHPDCDGEGSDMEFLEGQKIREDVQKLPPTAEDPFEPHPGCPPPVVNCHCDTCEGARRP